MDVPIFQKATVFCYRIFDVADAIDLERARRLLTEGTRRLKLARAGSEYLMMPDPPLGVELGKRGLALLAGETPVEVTARLFDHGAATLILAVPVPPGTSMDGLTRLADELYDSPSVDRLAVELLEGLRTRLVPAFDDPHLWGQSESYTILFAERIEGDPTAAELLEKADIARLLLGEVHQELAERERQEVTQHHFSYTPQDLVVVDWNSAFVYEPSGSRDIPDVLEICNAQLLELRYYDDLLDIELQRIYGEVRKKRRAWYSIFSSPYKVLERRVLATLMEMSEFIERVENSLKIIGDFYLARVYEAAVRRLRIPSWQESVTRKQRLLAQVYELLKGQMDTDRSLTLEFTIALLIVIELVVALLSVIKH